MRIEWQLLPELIVQKWFLLTFFKKFLFAKTIKIRIFNILRGISIKRRLRHKGNDIYIFLIIRIKLHRVISFGVKFFRKHAVAFFTLPIFYSMMKKLHTHPFETRILRLYVIHYWSFFIIFRPVNFSDIIIVHGWKY